MIQKKKLIQKILVCSLLTFLLSIFTINLYFNSHLLLAAKSVSSSPTSKIAGAVINTTPNVPTQKSQPDLVPTLNIIQKAKSTATPETPTQPIAIPKPPILPIPTPIPTPEKIADIEIANFRNFKIQLRENETAFSSLLRLSEDYSFTLEYQNYGSLGAFISCINGICANNQSYWALYYNNAYSQKGASLLRLFPNDTVSWKLEKY